MTAILEREYEELAVEEPFRWTYEAFIQASNSGIFGGGRFELLHGEVFRKMTMKKPHFDAVYRTLNVLQDVFEPQVSVVCQSPLVLSSESAPEPDVAVLRGRVEAMPELPTSALLVVEVADETLRKDRTTKMAIYAQAQIPEYWILNLNDRILEVYRQPAALPGERFGWGYRQITRLSEGDSIAPLERSENPISVASLLPSPTP